MDLRRVQEILRDRNLDALIVSSSENLFYAAGLDCLPTSGNTIMFMLRRIGPVFVLVPQKGEPHLILSYGTSMYLEKLSPSLPIRYVPTGMHLELPSGEEKPPMWADGAFKGLVRAIEKEGLQRGRLGLELDDLPSLHYRALRIEVPHASLIDAREALIEMRMVKDRREIEIIREANRRTVRAIKNMARAIDVGVPESEALRVLKDSFLRQGCLWWHTTLGIGANGADPYHVAGMSGDYRGKRGDMVRWDIGGSYRHYASDLARTMCIREAPEKARRLNEILAESTRRMIAAIRPGVRMGDVYHIGVNYVRDHGYPQYQRGMMGHSVGIEVEEYPFIEPGEERTFQPGMVFAVESPFYWKGFSGFNMEQNVLVTETGTEILSAELPFELITCPYQGD